MNAWQPRQAKRGRHKRRTVTTDDDGWWERDSVVTVCTGSGAGACRQSKIYFCFSCNLLAEKKGTNRASRPQKNIVAGLIYVEYHFYGALQSRAERMHVPAESYADNHPSMGSMVLCSSPKSFVPDPGFADVARQKSICASLRRPWGVWTALARQRLNSRYLANFIL